MHAATIHYTLTVDEVADAIVEHHPMLRAGRRRCRVLALGIAAGGIYLVASLPILAAVYLTYGGVLLLNNLRWYQARHQRRIVAATPAATEPVSASVDEHGLRLEAVTSDSTISWEAYQAVVDAPGGIALVQRGGPVRWIPERAFAGRDEKQAWLALATAGIEDAVEERA